MARLLWEFWLTISLVKIRPKFDDKNCDFHTIKKGIPIEAVAEIVGPTFTHHYQLGDFTNRYAEQNGDPFRHRIPLRHSGRNGRTYSLDTKSPRRGNIASLADRAVFIVQFLAIHSFQEGNGRLSRFLTTLMLLRAGYAYVSYASLESVLDEIRGSIIML